MNRSLALLSAAAVLAHSAAPARAEEREDAASEVTTEQWREPDVPLDLHWHLLALPEYAVELAFSPIGLLVETVERYRLDLRIYDLLRNDAGTIVLIPNLKLAFGDGLGFGGKLSFKELFGGERRLNLEGTYRLNADYDLGAFYKHVIAAAEGRELVVGATWEVDRNMPYFGIGNDSQAEKHVLRADTLDAALSMDLTARGVADLIGLVEFGFRYEKLATGDDPAHPGVGGPDSMVAEPVGFGQTVGYPRFRALIQYDTRDNLGRPSRGVVTTFEGVYTQDVSGADLSGMTLSASVEGFIPLLPYRRVLRVALGIGAAIPGRPGDEIPLHSLITLGRKYYLRGYSRGRFRDELGWWGSLEYRFPIFEYTTTGIALTPALFVDVGRVGSNVEQLFETPIRYSGGIGLRAAHDLLHVFTLQVGASPEGFELDFSLGKSL